MNNAIRIMIVEDHSLVRSGFRLLLERSGDFEVIGDVANAEQALDALPNQVPDVLVTDIAMPGINGIKLVGRVTDLYPSVRCIVLSMHKSSQYVRSALAAGAAGYLVKDAVATDLPVAIHTVMRGEIYLSPGISTAILSGVEVNSGAADLTERQLQVLEAIAEGQTTREIANQLGVGQKTVESHRAELMKRVGIHDVAGLVRFAVREGIVDIA